MGRISQTLRGVYKVLTVVGLVAAITNVNATEQQELLELRNTVINLVDALVKQGVAQKAHTVFVGLVRIIHCEHYRFRPERIEGTIE